MKYILLTILLVLGVIFKLIAQTQSDSAQLKAMTESIQQNEYTGIHSVLITKGNKLVYEQYFDGFNMDSLHDSRSSFKSITSLLLGIAIDKGFIKNINQHVYTFFPEETAFAADSLKRKITIKDLIEMRSGFDCDEWNDEKDCESEMVKTNDWVKFSLALPMKYNPGTVWAYTSCNPMIIGGIISKASGMSVMDFAKKYLFDDMGIKRYRWTTDPTGHGMTGGSFYILPGDMIKIGLLVKNNGLWNGKRIVSEKWIRESTNATIPIHDNSFIKISRSKIAIPQPTYYGYYWYKEKLKTDKYTEDVVFASGNGGQYIFIIKNLDLVIVFTQGNYESWKAKRAFDILTKYIIPAYQ